MHLQVRLVPVTSPPDVSLLLSRLAEAGVDLAAVGGSNVEFGGEFAFVPQDGQEETAFELLNTHGYTYRVFYKDDDNGLDLVLVDNKTGGLQARLAEIAEKNLQRGRIIRDILIGVPHPSDEYPADKVPVQIYSEAVRTPNSLKGSGS